MKVIGTTFGGRHSVLETSNKRYYFCELGDIMSNVSDDGSGEGLTRNHGCSSGDLERLIRYQQVPKSNDTTCKQLDAKPTGTKF